MLIIESDAMLIEVAEDIKLQYYPRLITLQCLYRMIGELEIDIREHYPEAEKFVFEMTKYMNFPVQSALFVERTKLEGTPKQFFEGMIWYHSNLMIMHIYRNIAEGI